MKFLETLIERHSVIRILNKTKNPKHLKDALKAVGSLGQVTIVTTVEEAIKDADCIVTVHKDYVGKVVNGVKVIDPNGKTLY